MKKIALLFCILFCNNFFAQVNIVPNPGFETVITCNDDSLGGGIWGGIAPPWDSPTGNGSPDLFNSCSYSSLAPIFQVPSNIFGYQYAHGGNGYAGIEIYGQGGSTDYREYMQVELDSTLRIQQYYVSFYVSFANHTPIANNNIGVYFSATHINIPGNGLLNFIPQINDTNIVSDTLNWTLISGTYTAHGGERYIIIGNFYADSLTDTLHNVSGTLTPPGSYYYVDDVDVHRCSDAGVGEVGIKNEELRIVPNPNNGEFSINLSKQYKSVDIEITDVLGKTVYIVKQRETNLINLTLNQPPGLYFVTVIVDNKRQVMKLTKQ